MIPIEKKEEVANIVTERRKVSIKWLSLIVSLSEEELIELAPELGLLIEGDKILITTEQGVQEIQERGKKKSTRIIKSTKLYYRIFYCPKCGWEIDHKELMTKNTSICSSCNFDMNIPLLDAKENNTFNLHCTVCGFANPTDVKFCVNCGEQEFSEEKQKSSIVIHPNVKRPFYQRTFFIYFLSLVIATGISCAGVLGVSRQFIIAEWWITGILITCMSLILSWLVFIAIGVLLKKEKE